MRPVCLFTDFGQDGPYVGQVKAALHRCRPQVPVIDLMADAPVFDPQAAAYLLAALLPYTPDDAVVMGVVDPGVGGARLPLVAEVDGRLLVGPDNGLFAIALRRARHACAWALAWRPERLSASFHGRDLFAPVAAMLAAGEARERLAGQALTPLGADWPDDLDRIIYVDHYGNVVTGLRGETVAPDRRLCLGGMELSNARTFSDVPAGQAFWYVNSIGLVEISVNNGRASSRLSIDIGDKLG